MKQIVLIYLILLSLLTLGCEKNIRINSVVGKWEVISLYKNKNCEPKLDNKYILEFNIDNSASILLDANECIGNFSISCDGCIKFEDFGCTKICCDSDYANTLIEVIRESTKYDISDDILTLSSIGEVKLKWVD